MKLDHVAIATPDARDLLVHLVGTLGGVVIGGDQGVGFRPMQIRVGDGERGMTVEILEPWRTSDNDFLERFLDSNGPGPHHLTFKVRDIDDTLALVRDAGYSPVGVNTSDPVWKEFFLHPREAHGTVVQLAESGGGDLSGPGARLEYLDRHGPDEYLRPWWPDPPPRGSNPAWIRRVVVTGPDLGVLEALYGGLLQGCTVARTDDSCEMTWGHGAHILLERDNEGAPGIRRIEFVQPDTDHPDGGADGQPDEVTRAGAWFVRVSPDYAA